MQFVYAQEIVADCRFQFRISGLSLVQILSHCFDDFLWQFHRNSLAACTVWKGRLIKGNKDIWIPPEEPLDFIVVVVVR